MAEFKSVIITKQGQALMANTLSGSGNIRFTRLDVSDKIYADEELETLTAVSDVKQSTSINHVSKVNEVAVKLEAVITNEELAAGYHMQTVGLFASAEDTDEEVLYGVMIAEKAGWMPAYNGIGVSSAMFDLYVTVGNAENVSVEINSGAYATVTMLEDVRSIALGNNEGGKIDMKYSEREYILNADCTNPDVQVSLYGAHNQKWVTVIATRATEVMSLEIGSIAHVGGNYKVYIREHGGARIEADLGTARIGLSTGSDNFDYVNAEYYVDPRDPGLKILQFSAESKPFNRIRIFSDSMKLKCDGPGKIADIWLEIPKRMTTTVKKAVESLIDDVQYR